MASLKDIQSLIADIDSILPKADARLPWSKPGDMAQERRVLGRVRSYLVSQQQNFAAASTELPLPATPAQQQVVDQIMQAVTQEMKFLRANLMQPLQSDIEALRQQREALVQEIRQLEQKRRQIDSISQGSTPQQQIISEFSQGLIDRYSESLTQQLAQILANFERRMGHSEWPERSHDAAYTPYSPIPLAGSDRAIAPAFLDQEPMEPVRQAPSTSEQLRKLQAHTDQLLITLEANQRAIFEALERDLRGYQASLSQGLEKMHNLGSQGEMLFTAVVNRWLEPLTQDPSTRLSSSVPPSDLANPTQAKGISLTTPETLVPSAALSFTEPLPLEPLSLQPKPVTEDATQPVSTSSQETIPTADSSPLLSEPSQSTPQNNVLQNLTSEDWEIVEGIEADNLDFELDDNDQLETFIQLDLEEPTSFSSPEGIGTPNSLDSQDSDFLLAWLNERQQDVSESEVAEVTGLDNSEVAAELTLNADRRRQEIDELYQSLFGTDALTDTVNKEASDFSIEGKSDSSESMPASEEFPAIAQNATPEAIADDPSVNADSVTSLPPQVEDALFAGLSVNTDAVEQPPDILPSQAQPPTEATQEWAQSWEAVFFEESESESLSQTDLPQQAQSSVSTDDSHQNSLSRQEAIVTIAALTDLFEEMGLSPEVTVAEDHFLPTPTPQPSESQTPNSEASRVEDHYIPASPEEDLLETTTLESDPEVDLSLDPNTLQQLQQDLDSFEGSMGQTTPRQDEQQWLSPDLEGSTVTPGVEPSYAQNQPFFMPPQESLAEDWEEFVLNYWLREREFANDAIPTAAELVESDFDPDLFPSEALELDQETTIQASVADSGELITQENEPAYFAFEDEPVVDEMRWDEPTDSTTEEAIAPWDATASFASPELELDSDFFTQEVLDTDLEGEGSTAMPGALREEGHPEASDPRQDPISPQDVLEHDSDNLAASGVDLEQPESENVELSTPNHQVVTSQEPSQPSTEGLSEDSTLENLTQEGELSSESNFQVNFPHTEALNSEQSDNPEKINPGSDSEAQP
ncbi:hypothetical protein [Allocoleopsis sp.]|uniref:hypothetical protein n=1 Tax=Allocoleopsis sp. TaxID=3088169 RepID=UPI002FD539D3